MNRQKLIFQGAGTTLLLLGFINLYLLAWSSYYSISSASCSLDFSIFAIVGGILFFRGGLRFAKFLRIYVLLALPGYLLYPILSFFMAPLDYQLLVMRLEPGDWVESILWQIWTLAFMFWLQYVLGRDEITNAQVDARITSASPRPFLWTGLAATLIVAGILYTGLHGSDAKEAIQVAKSKFGNNYKYFATNIHLELSEPVKVTVVVIAYNADDIQYATIRWKEASSDISN